MLIVIVDADVVGGGGGGGTGVGGADDAEIDEVRIPVDSLGTSLSDKLYRLRVEVDCEIVEESGIGSVECSESDRERDCLSVLVLNCFRKEEISGISGDTNGGSVGDDDRWDPWGYKISCSRDKSSLNN